MAQGDSTTTTSIRMVPQSQPETMAAGALMPETTQQSHQQEHDHQHHDEAPPRKSITVTRTLEIERTSSPAPTKSASMEGTATRGYVQGASSETQPLRAVTSLGALLPTIPKMSAIDLSRPFIPTMTMPQSRPSTAPEVEEPVVAPIVAPRLPPFMQSRRWARMCEAPARPKSSSGHDRAVSKEDRPMTLREASFEQQRAIWKHAAAAVDMPEPIEETTTQSPKASSPPKEEVQRRGEPVRPDDVSSILATQGLCRPLSLPTWQVVRATRATRTSSQSAGNVFRRLGMHRASKRHRKQQSVEKTPPRVSRSSQIGRKRAVSDLRKQANPPAQRRQASRSQIVDLDVYTPPRGQVKRPSSPVPSLHDPEKAKRFSEECEEMLSNTHFEKDFISPPVSRSPTDASKPAAVEPSGSAPNDKPSPSSIDTEQATAPQNTVRIMPPSPMITAPEPPERSSSKNAARLATVVQMTKPTCMPILNGFRDSAMVTADDASEQVPAQHSLVVPQRLRAPFRMASNASTMKSTDDSVAVPRAAISTDTLMLIEAQVPEQPPTSLVGRLRQKTGFGPSLKKLGPSGLPPERPLPDLPAEDASVSTRAGPARAGSNTSKRDSKQSDASQPLHRNVSDADVKLVSVRHAPTVAAGKGLTVKAIDSESLGDSIMPTPSSVYSQASYMSDLSVKPKFVRHDKTKFRSERISQVKRRYKNDINRHDRRISEEGEDDTDAETRDVLDVFKELDPPLPPPPNLREQPSLDQLDQFPPVPASRPASRTSHNSGSKRGHSRPRSHVRQTSKASSRYSYRPTVPRIPTNGSTARQILGASQIRVLVDTNPLTGRFRAGAISPDRASSGSSQEGSPAKSQASSMPIGLRSLRSVPYLPLPSRIDENGDFYDHNSTTSASPIRQRSAKSPRKEASLRSLHSHTGSTGRRLANTSRQSHYRSGKTGHRRMSTDTYASLNSSASASESEDEEAIPLLPLSTSTTATTLNIVSPNEAKVATSKRKKLRRRWNSDDVKAVQALCDVQPEYESKLLAAEREVRRLKDEIKMMKRVMAPMDKARGLRTDTSLADDASIRSRDTTIFTPSPGLVPAPLMASTSISAIAGPRTMVSANGSPSRSTVRALSPAKMGPYTHAHSNSFSSSQAQLDALEADIKGDLRAKNKASTTSKSTGAPDTLRERPISNISSLSATSYSTHGSGVSTASSAKLAGPSRRDLFDLSSGGEAEPRRSKEEGSLTDPREYDLDFSPTVESKRHADAVVVRKPVGSGQHANASSTAPTTQPSGTYSASGASATTTTKGGPESPRPKSRGTLSSLRSFRSKTSRSNNHKQEKAVAIAIASPVVGLHRPPPIPKTIKREVLSEEEDGFLSAASNSKGAAASSSGGGGVGVVRKEGYLRIQGLGSSVEDLLDAEDDEEGGSGSANTKTRNERAAMKESLGAELGLAEVRRGLGLRGQGDDPDEIVLRKDYGPLGGGGGMKSGSHHRLLILADDDDEDNEAVMNRLSVNHAFSRTEAFDRMLESFS